ncbi:entry exclusion protein TrbK [Allorhizobium borbori]|uniref:Ti type entry exclusion protein TrbK n=1 Tax=Allorhizobium borbori TaxID=485907 RepID=A0A7W6P0C2_9HYPH|nr:Ti type entry exclusion protein TrbK [Allorhizobium borbori]
MSRTVVIVMVLVMVAAAASATTIYFVQANAPATGMSEEQRATREKFFGTAKELPPIEKGQEMRPRW